MATLASLSTAISLGTTSITMANDGVLFIQLLMGRSGGSEDTSSVAITWNGVTIPLRASVIGAGFTGYGHGGTMIFAKRVSAGTHDLVISGGGAHPADYVSAGVGALYGVGIDFASGASGNWTSSGTEDLTNGAVLAVSDSANTTPSWGGSGTASLDTATIAGNARPACLYAGTANGTLSCGAYAKFTSPISTTNIGKSMQYVVDAAHAATKSMKYTLTTTPAAATKSADYYIRKTTAIPKSTQYVIDAPHAVTKSMQYALFVPGLAITKGLAYHVLTDPIIQRATRYAVIIATLISTTFSKQTHLQAMQTAASFLNDQWYWRIKPDGTVELAVWSDTKPTHILVLNRDIDSLEITSSLLDVKNKVVLDWGGGPTEAEYEDATSETAYGRRMEAITDSNISDSTAAGNRGNGEVSRLKDPAVKVIAVVNSSYPIETILPGDTVVVVNIKGGGQQMLTGIMRIIRTEYDGSLCTLQLSEVTDNFGTEIAKMIG